MQECSIDMEVSSLDQETVFLLAENFTLTQPEDMNLFTIVSSGLRNTSLPNKGIQMKISMKRKIMSEMMTTYFPSLLLMMITYRVSQKKLSFRNFQI